jgi:hypothetical protein
MLFFIIIEKSKYNLPDISTVGILDLSGSIKEWVFGIYFLFIHHPL